MKGDVNPHIKVPEKIKEMIFISKTNYLWLQCSAIGSLHLGCLIKGLKEGLEMQGVEVKIQSLDGYYLLITFFDSKMMKVLTESYLNCFKPWLSNLVAYNYNVVQQEMFCWVRLDEISFQIWHLNSFKALGDRWDEFVKPDANTMALSRLDYGRILFKVKSVSSFSAYTFHMGKIMFKIKMIVMEVLSAPE